MSDLSPEWLAAARTKFGGRASATVLDVWFEPGTPVPPLAPPLDEQRLLVTLQHALGIAEFHTCFLGGVVVFRMVADIKGRRVFAASEWHPADDPTLSLPGPLLLISGPLRREPQDAA
jgi:hypothetical protein